MYILFDIGATQMRIASSRDGKKIADVKIVSTPDNFMEGMALFQKLAPELARHERIKAVAGGTAGSLDRKKGMIFDSPNLPDWNNKPLRKTLEQMFDTKKIYLENDTALVGLGEAVEGAGKKNNIVAYVTISTGVNGVRIVDGTIDRSAMGFEIGHQIIGGYPDKTLENAIGAAALARRYNMPASQITDPMVWEIAHLNLAYGLHNTILHWSPDIVVLGGGQVRAGSIKMEKINTFVSKLRHMFPTIPPIKKASLGDLGGIHGALIYLRQQKKRK